MSKRHRKTKDLLSPRVARADSEGGYDPSDWMDDMYLAPKGRKPKGRERRQRQRQKHAFYDL